MHEMSPEDLLLQQKKSLNHLQCQILDLQLAQPQLTMMKRCKLLNISRVRYQNEFRIMMQKIGRISGNQNLIKEGEKLTNQEFYNSKGWPVPSSACPTCLPDSLWDELMVRERVIIEDFLANKGVVLGCIRAARLGVGRSVYYYNLRTLREKLSRFNLSDLITLP